MLALYLKRLNATANLRVRQLGKLPHYHQDLFYHLLDVIEAALIRPVLVLSDVVADCFAATLELQGDLIDRIALRSQGHGFA